MHLGDEVGGRYRLVEGPVLGGNGEVWLAYDKDLGQNVALKRARIDGGSQDDFERLRAESRALARFRNHPHVVTLYDAIRVGEGKDAECWLVMEHAAGGSLAGRPRSTVAEAARLGAQVAGALAALHAEDLVHCDVKPGNIVLVDDSTAKLTDLDSAHRAGGTETITPTRRISYTPDYAAPEVVRGNPVPKSDVFSLAATVHELIAGKPPRDDAGEDEDERLKGLRFRRGAVRLDRAVGPLAGTLAAMLRPRPQDRPSAAQAQALLEEAAGRRPRGRGPSGATRGDGPARGRLPVPGVWRRHPRVTAAAGTALAALAVLAALAFTPLLDDDGPGARTGRGGGGSAGDRREGAIGDPRTVDPCAVARPSALARFGETELDRDYGNFDRCDVLVTSGRSEVDVQLDFNRGDAPEQPAPAKSVGSVEVVEEPTESDACTRTLLPTRDKGYDVTVTAQQDGEGKAPLCAMADEAADGAARKLDEGRLPRRSPPLPRNSLARQDACTLLDGNALSVVPGVDAADPDIGFGNWDCDWASTTSKTVAKLRFDRGQTPSDEEARTTRLGDRDAYVLREGEGPGTCLVLVVHRSYADQHGDEAAEMLHVVAEGRQSQHELCGTATRLARSAARELPAP